MKLTALLSLLLISTALAVYAQVPSDKPVPSREVPSHPVREVVQNRSAQIAPTRHSTEEATLLKEQIRLMNHYQESLLTTVYWSLGGVVGLALLLSGFSWWTNFRFYESDKKKLAQELDGKLLDAQKSAEIAALKAASSEANEIRSELVSLRDKIDSLSKEILGNKQGLEGTIADIEKSLAASDAQLRFVEEFVWDTRNNQYNVLLTQVQGADSARESGETNQAKRVLERMKGVLERKVLPSGEKFTTKEASFIQDRLKELENLDVVLVAEISKMLGVATESDPA